MMREARGGDYHNLGEIFDGSPDTDAFEGRADVSCPADDSRLIPKG